MVNALLALASQLTEANQDELQFKETTSIQKQQKWPALIQIKVVLELE
jgi:hypothetical protein